MAFETVRAEVVGAILLVSVVIDAGAWLYIEALKADNKLLKADKKILQTNADEYERAKKTNLQTIADLTKANSKIDEICIVSEPQKQIAKANLTKEKADLKAHEDYLKSHHEVETDEIKSFGNTAIPPSVMYRMLHSSGSGGDENGNSERSGEAANSR